MMGKSYSCGKKNEILKWAVKDAIDYQKTIIDAHTIDNISPDSNFHQVIKNCKNLIKDYQRLYYTL